MKVGAFQNKIPLVDFRFEVIVKRRFRFCVRDRLRLSWIECELASGFAGEESKTPSDQSKK
jgi:hypothetical protein